MVDTIGRVWSGGDLLLVEHSPACPFGQAFVVMFYDSDELLTTRFGCLKFRRQISWQPHRVRLGQRRTHLRASAVGHEPTTRHAAAVQAEAGSQRRAATTIGVGRLSWRSVTAVAACRIHPSRRRSRAGGRGARLIRLARWRRRVGHSSLPSTASSPGDYTAARVMRRARPLENREA